jgi:predicted membrane-bound dolichyl-phosphate-mannose-protein mannosyltransferase
MNFISTKTLFTIIFTQRFLPIFFLNDELLLIYIVSAKSIWWRCPSLCLAALIISLIISFMVSYLAHRPRLALAMPSSFRLLNSLSVSHLTVPSRL